MLINVSYMATFMKLIFLCFEGCMYTYHCHFNTKLTINYGSHVSSYLLKIELVSFINSIFKNLFFFYHIKYRRKAINLTVHCVF